MIAIDLRTKVTAFRKVGSCQELVGKMLYLLWMQVIPRLKCGRSLSNCYSGHLKTLLRLSLGL
jgi:hypothetical protein